MNPWHYLMNPILISALQSYLTGLNLSNYHDNALSANKADTFILEMYNKYHPIHLNYVNCYNLYITQHGSKEGETLNVYQLLRILSGVKAPKWDVGVQAVYPTSTPAYKKLFPNRRGPFQKGSNAERLEAVRALSTAIGTDTALATVKTDVDAFCTLLDNAIKAQQESKTSVKDLTLDLDTALEQMCNAQYSDLGGLIQKYPANTETIAQYFDMNILRKIEQTLFTGTIKPLERAYVVKRTFNVGDEVVLTNLTNATLKFYLAKLKGDLPGTKFVELPKGEQTITAEQLGNLTDPFLMVQNTNGDIWGKYEIEIV
jgi:hypothetical protein